jgi:hypothetical protein
MEGQILTRKQLYNLVWSKPMLFLSRKYNISISRLQKICIKMEIPMPRALYWQKLQNGEDIKQPPLPTGYSGDQEITFTLRREDYKTKPRKALINNLSPLQKLQKEIESHLGTKLIVPKKLIEPDILIIRANELLTKRIGSYNEMVKTYSEDAPDIVVSKSNISRALRFMDTLIKTLRLRGHDILLNDRNAYALIKKQRIKIRLREKTSQVKKFDKWLTTEYHPTGILYLKMDGYYGGHPSKEWSDNSKQSLENYMSEILARLEIEGERLYEEEIRREKAWAILEEEKRIQKEYEARKEMELAHFKEALQKATRWHKANDLRSYIDAVETKALANNNLSDEIINWLHWAREKADWYDPFIEKEDEFLNEVDKDNLTSLKKKTSFGA